MLSFFDAVLYNNGGLFNVNVVLPLPLPPPLIFYYLDNSGDRLIDDAGDYYIANRQ